MEDAGKIIFRVCSSFDQTESSLATSSIECRLRKGPDRSDEQSPEMNRERWSAYAGIIERTTKLRTARGGAWRVVISRGKIREARSTIDEADESPTMAVAGSHVAGIVVDDTFCKHLRRISNSKGEIWLECERDGEEGRKWKS
jgi:hypothetical protein